ncbi:MAG: HAD hydrolase-like protein [Candidatus Curtissbacteria bacterium]|nr:HAD hydrolase-like protein [Candidatus Curtissbacteria bacterium]
MTDLSNIRYIISDWDGTLSDSWPDYLAAFCKLMEEKFGVDPDKSKQYYNFTAGAALSNQIKEAAQKFANTTVEDTIELENLFWKYQKDLPAPPVINGASQALQELKNKGYKIVVWSGTRSDILVDRLVKTDLDKFIDFSIGNVPGSSTQVKGQGLFAEIAKHLNISTDELRQKAVVIGDGTGDIKAGREVGCPTIGIPKKPEDGKVLETAGADFVIQSIKDLPSLLTK